MSELRFEGRVAVVTGAGRGLGRAYAHMLARRGAQVVVNDLGTSVAGTGRDPGTAREVVDEIEGEGGVAVANGEDVSTEAGADSIVATAIDAFGRLDVLINNAGIVAYRRFEDVKIDEFIRHVDVHLVGSFNLSRSAWGHMVRQRYGRIVMTVSSAIFGRPDLVPYASAKAGVVGLGRSLAVAGADNGIRVNMVSPFASTRMWPGSTSLPDAEGKEEWLPEQVAQLVAFLAHEECPANGEIYRAAAGRVSRVFLAETTGAFVQNAEAIRDDLTEINDEQGYFVARDSVHLNERAMEIAERRTRANSSS